MLNIKYKWLFSVTLSAFMVFGAMSFEEASAAQIPVKQQVQSPAAKPAGPVSNCAVNYMPAKALDITKEPSKYLNKNIMMDATFDKFATLGLDYKPALREYSKYIGFLIQRDDVKDHDVPLSEMKIFLKREYAEKFVDLETGDKIQIKGKVFSAALGDPWIDVDELIIVKKAKVKEESKEAAK